MKILKILFPLSRFYNTDKRFFASLVIHIGIYLLGTNLPVRFVPLITMIYVFLSALTLFVNYFVISKKEADE